MPPLEQASAKPMEPADAGRGKWAYAAMVVAAAVLAVTGIGTFALGKAPMTHWVLMAHVSAAPLFALGIALVALARAERAGALFWFILACGVVVLLSGVLPMTPLFGTEGEHALYLTHRYSAIALAAGLALQLIVGRRSR